MKTQSLITSLFVLLFIISNGQSKPDSKSITDRWIEIQAEYMSIAWLFHPGGNFTNITYWGAEQPKLQGRIFKGTYTLDTLSQLITIKCNKVIYLSNDKVIQLDSSDLIEEWKILSLNEGELKLMELAYYKEAIKSKITDFSNWNTRLLIRSNNFIYNPKKS